VPTTHAPRKRRRPRLADPLATWRAFSGQAMIERAQVALVHGQVAAAITAFSQGHDCLHHWRLLADAFNVAESLAALRIGSDAESRERIARAQQVLAAVYQRWQLRASWTLHAAELNALREAEWLHHIQLQYATLSEFERACVNTAERLQQARAGNAPAGAIVLGTGAPPP